MARINILLDLAQYDKQTAEKIGKYIFLGNKDVDQNFSTNFSSFINNVSDDHVLDALKKCADEQTRVVEDGLIARSYL